MTREADRFFSALLTEGDTGKYIRMGDIGEVFTHVPSDLEHFEFIQGFMKKYGKLPRLKTFNEKTGKKLKKKKESSDYYYDTLIERHITKTLIHSARIANNHIVNKEAQKAYEVMRDALEALALQKSAPKISDFKESHDMLKHEIIQKNEPDYGINTGWDYFDNMNGSLRAGDLTSICGRTSLGKAQPLHCKILMQDGSFKKMGEIQIGDKIASLDGMKSEVQGIYPQGQRPSYRITFADGRKTEVDEEHLWEIHNVHWKDPKILTTKEIIEKRKAKRNVKHMYIKMVSGDFGVYVSNCRYAYILGALIGDGCITRSDITITSMDKDIIQKIEKELPPFHCLSERTSTSSGKAITYGIYNCKKGESNLITQALREWGLLGTTSLDKFIPEECFSWDKESRLRLIRGLLDTDGFVGRYSGSLQFSSSSLRLIKGVMKLIRSIGGKAKLLKIKKTTHADHYLIGIIYYDSSNLFFCDRKKSKTRKHSRHDPTKLRIKNIEYMGEQECQCISVTHPSKLYVTNDYIVTHNTWLMLFIALYAWQKHKKPILFFSMEMDVILIMERLSSMYQSIPYNRVKLGQFPKGLRGKDTRKEFLDNMMELGDSDMPSFNIVGGNLTTNIDEIIALSRQLQPEAVFVDGAYLVKTTQRFQKHERIGYVANSLKSDIGTNLAIPVFASWQFNKEVTKLKKGQKAGTEHIGGADEIGNVSSIVMGLFEEESSSTIRQRRVEIVKGRGGERGSFFINWNFRDMNFEQVEEIQDYKLMRT